VGMEETARGQLMLAALVRVKRFSYRRSVREC
jgi:hypothetical protein